MPDARLAGVSLHTCGPVLFSRPERWRHSRVIEFNQIQHENGCRGLRDERIFESLVISQIEFDLPRREGARNLRRNLRRAHRTMLIYDVLHKEKVYRVVANDLRSLGVKYRFKKSMLKSERPEVCKNVPRRVFKIPLFYQALDIVSLSSGAIVHVPVFVIRASAFLEKHITQEGLFRKAGSQARQKELISRLDGGGGLSEKSNAIDVASCLKSFFRDLPEPLIPYAYHDLFVHCALLKSYRVQALLLACILLPPYHLNTLAFFMEFLKKVSTHEKHNKMNIENLAKVIGPNIMPLQDTSMSAVQNRLQMHLSIVKILIENSENIGILPTHIAQSISMEMSGSTDNGLDSFELHAKSKKKKQPRSASLTRMINGLKKMVGKSADDTPNSNCPQSSTNSLQLNVSSNKFTKKRKITERERLSNVKKKGTADKVDKSKRLRLSLDKFVSKNKQRTDDDLSDSCANNYKPCCERRWSSVSSSSHTHKIHNKCCNGISCSRSTKCTEQLNNFQQEYEDVLTDATVDLSDNIGEHDLLDKNHRGNQRWNMNVSASSRKLNATDESDNMCLLTLDKTDSDEFDISLPNNGPASLSSDHGEEDYVKIPKSEYEDIKNRVSAIETRISQEFGCIYNEDSDILAHSVNTVQTAYEKTLEEANIEDTLSSDYLAKRLSKELKIRRSGEHKIIRSPSARKIGSLRRRSQEKVTSKRVRRTASWHISPNFTLQHHVQLDNQMNVYPIERESIFSSNYLEGRSYSADKDNGSVSANTRDEIICLRKTNTVISAERHGIPNSGDSNLRGLEDPHAADNRTVSSVRRASSFHGKDFVDNSSYFDNKVDDLKKTNSHQNIVLNNDCPQGANIIFESSKEVTWNDAVRYFKSSPRTNTSAPQTGRPSVAKLRAQNAGMVLAKARLFDECTTKTPEFATAGTSSNKKHRDATASKRSPKTSKETQISRKQSNKDSSGKKCHAMPSPSARTRTQSANSPSKPIQERADRSRRSAQKLESQNPKVPSKDPVAREAVAKEKRISDAEAHQKENLVAKASPLIKVSANTENSTGSPYKPDVTKTTPHIKRPLTAKTPRSTKIVRRPPVDTRRTPLKATVQLGTPKRQSPKSILKTRALSTHA